MTGIVLSVNPIVMVEILERDDLVLFVNGEGEDEMRIDMDTF